MVGVDGPFGPGERRLGRLDREVGRQAALGLAQVHRPACGLEAEAEFPSGLDLRAEQVPGAAREDVGMVGGGGAAAGQQGCDGPARRGVHHLLVDPGPDRVQLREPLEQGGLLRTAPGQPLVEVVMRVNQARGEQVTRHVDPLGWDAVVIARQRAGAHRRDQVVLHHDVPGGELGGGRVHGGDVRTLDDDPALRHGADVRGPVYRRQREPPAPLACQGAGLGRRGVRRRNLEVPGP